MGKPGMSEISVPKHDALKYLLDIERDAISNQLRQHGGPRRSIKEVVWHDLMSGDGVCDKLKTGRVRSFDKGHSAGIFLSRAKILSHKFPDLPITVNLNEKNLASLTKLRARLEQELPAWGWTKTTSPNTWRLGQNVTCYIRRGDSRRVDLRMHSRETAVFINQDPNSFTQLVVPEGYETRANYWQTSFFVLGMNSTGARRLRTSTSPSHDGVWMARYEQLMFLATRRASHQDVVVFAPGRGGHGFVYLLITAKKSVDNSMKRMHEAFTRYGYEAEMCSYEQDPKRFDDIMWALL